MNVYQKLMEVQTRLKAPKSQFNAFGEYNYRSTEDILEGLKPLLKEVGAIVTIEDEIKLIGDRYYVEATVSFTDIEKGETVQSRAYAREEMQKKKMDSSQLTGSTSSYARKYALNGLFAIDDTKDSDFTNKGDQEVRKPAARPVNKNTVRPINPGQVLKCEACGIGITENIANYSKKNLGKGLCLDCQRKAKGGQ